MRFKPQLLAILLLMILFNHWPAMALNDGAGTEYFSSNLGIHTMPRSGSALDVNGTLISNGFQLTTGFGSGKLLSSDAAGNASWATASSALGISGSIVGTSDSQILTNKTFTDNVTYFQDQTTNSKKLQFELSSIDASTTRTLTVPNASGTIALTSASTGTISINDLSDAVAGSTAPSSYSVFIGDNSGELNSSNTYSVAVGISALAANTVGMRNTAIGYQSITTNVDGDNNVALGNAALSLSSNGNSNIAIGYAAGNNITTRLPAKVKSKSLV